MQQAVAYYRVSTKNQEESGLGLETQKKAVFYFTQAAGYKVIMEFTEQESGKNSKRPKLKAALRYCRKYEATLLIANIARLTRNVRFACALLESPTKFIAVDKPWAEEYDIHQDAAWAQRELKEISKRTKAALAAAKARGTKLGSNANNVVQINKERSKDFAKRMRPIIEALRKEGFTSIRKIAAELKRRRVKTFRGRYKWHKTSVHNMLTKLKIEQVF